MTNRSEIAQQRAIDNIVGSFRLEGLEIDEQALDDMKRVDRGEMSTDEAVKIALERVKNEEVQ